MDTHKAEEINARTNKNVFVPNRQIRFCEAFFDTQSQSFNLTAGILEISDWDKSKGAGVPYPAAELHVLHSIYRHRRRMVSR
jgi:hypothetical protein